MKGSFSVSGNGFKDGVLPARLSVLLQLVGCAYYVPLTRIRVHSTALRMAEAMSISYISD